MATKHYQYPADLSRKALNKSGFDIEVIISIIISIFFISLIAWGLLTLIQPSGVKLDLDLFPGDVM